MSHLLRDTHEPLGTTSVVDEHDQFIRLQDRVGHSTCDVLVELGAADLAEDDILNVAGVIVDSPDDDDVLAATDHHNLTLVQETQVLSIHPPVAQEDLLRRCGILVVAGRNAVTADMEASNHPVRDRHADVINDAHLRMGTGLPTQDKLYAPLLDERIPRQDLHRFADTKARAIHNHGLQRLTFAGHRHDERVFGQAVARTKHVLPEPERGQDPNEIPTQLGVDHLCGVPHYTDAAEVNLLAPGTLLVNPAEQVLDAEVRRPEDGYAETGCVRQPVRRIPNEAFGGHPVL